ncbi:TetR family transcriptional regulator [Paenibacillus residui]|uniref:TetR family transcriptional regulator n=1 Tax=Paenibacillus residui TaxID=629724 RepID=A0ABW3D886_9BACL
MGEATFKVLMKYGLERLTVRKIAEEAGLTIGGVQYYFSNQQELYVYMCICVCYGVIVKKG